MNIVFTESGIYAYYRMVGVWKEFGKYTVKSKLICWDGCRVSLIDESVLEIFDTYKKAKDRCRTWAKNKSEFVGVKLVPECEVPSLIRPFLAPDVKTRITTAEFIDMVDRARRERYVVFCNNFGLDAFFDLGVEYLGYATDDPDMMEVFDKDGKQRGVRVSERLEKVVKTEDCLQVELVGKIV